VNLYSVSGQKHWNLVLLGEPVSEALISETVVHY
jgi:hypothetical protein